jgi:hypothetical protein
MFFPSKNPFSVPPRVFGCVSFVHNHSPNHDKLDPRAHMCIFIGYSRTQKGYRCYSPSLRKHFVSADVTFFEDIPYYSPKGRQLQESMLSATVIPYTCSHCSSNFTYFHCSSCSSYLSGLCSSAKSGCPSRSTTTTNRVLSTTSLIRLDV